jgi:hypothetical protein
MDTKDAPSNTKDAVLGSDKGAEREVGNPALVSGVSRSDEDSLQEGGGMESSLIQLGTAKVSGIGLNL